LISLAKSKAFLKNATSSSKSKIFELIGLLDPSNFETFSISFSNNNFFVHIV